MTNTEHDYEQNMEAESRFQIVGEATPSEARHLLKDAVQDSGDEVGLFYDWGGERGAGNENLPAHEAADYVRAVSGEVSVQAPGKSDKLNYWRLNPESLHNSDLDDYEPTELPNPANVSVDGAIEASAGYEDGNLTIFVGMDTDYEEEGEIHEGSLRVTYNEPFESGAENELQRTQEALEHLENLEHLLE